MRLTAIRVRPALRFVGAAACIMLAVAVAQAQETRRLDDQGNFEKEPAYAPNSPEGRLQAVRAAYAAKDYGETIDLASDWIDEYPTHPWLDQAYFLRANATADDDDLYESLFDYEYLIRSFPASELFEQALEKEYRIALAFLGGKNKKFLGMAILDASGEGEELLVRIQERYPGSELGEKAMLSLGDYYFNEANMSQAVDAYDLFLLNYPRSKYRERVMRRLVDASLARFKGPAYDPRGLLDASQRLRQYRQEFPAAAERIGVDALLVRIEESLAVKTLHTAQWYERQGKDVSAAYLYKRIIKDYASTIAAQEAVNRLRELDPKGIITARVGTGTGGGRTSDIIRAPLTGSGDKPDNRNPVPPVPRED
ncbi:MAG: outer membrane protein assembly factor BamD [Phycisphaeraceae bacterium]